VYAHHTSNGASYAFILIGGFLKGLKPEPILTVTQWAEKHRILNTKGSAEAGPYRVNRTPYLRKPMDCMSARSTYMRVPFMKASQIGASEAGFNIVGYYMDMVPCPIFYLMPTIQTMERKVKQTVDPMIEDCATLQAKVGKKRSKDGGNTLSQKDVPGGTAFFGGANSAASLASVPARVAVADEADRYPGDVDGEGSPLALLERRMLTFGSRKKLFIPSTPTIDGASVIQGEYEDTDQNEYWVPCPHCMQLQTLEFAQLIWEKGVYKDVHYKCIHCEKKIYNHHKTFMLQEDKSEYIPGHPDEGRARWLAKYPEKSRPEVIGFWLSALYSPDGWYSWTEMAEEWDKCENDEPRKKAFINTILGMPFKEKGIAPPWQQLFERAQENQIERNQVWQSTAFITAGVDVQGNRLEIDIVGWQKGRISQQIDYRVLMGDPTKEDVWEQLSDILNETWEFEAFDGAQADKRGRIGIRKMCIDANYASDHVHTFARKHGIKRVVPIQGRENLEMPYSAPKITTKTEQGKNVKRGKVWPVGTSYLKELLYGWLRLEIKEDGEVPKGFCHLLPMPEHYFRGMTAEERSPVRNKQTNAIKYKWNKKYERNEPLDCRIYAMAAAFMLGFDRWNDARWDKETGGLTPALSKGEGGIMSATTNGNNAEDKKLEEREQPDGPTVSEKKEGKKRKGGDFWNRRK
jgi:phage terminase large subunit GpA-like protein